MSLATEFSAILFLLFAWSSSNSPRSFQRFRRILRWNFNWIRQQMKNFPIDPHCKNCPLSALLKCCQKRAILQWGSMMKFFTRCQIYMKFCTRVCLKPSNDRGDFELDRARSENNIAENSAALGNKIHNRLFLCWKLSIPCLYVSLRMYEQVNLFYRQCSTYVEWQIVQSHIRRLLSKAVSDQGFHSLSKKSVTSSFIIPNLYLCQKSAV